MPPSLFQGTSHYPGLDHLVSGPVPVIPGAFTPRPLLHEQLRACCFRSGFLAKQVNLTTETNSLPRLSERMTRPCNPPFVLSHCWDFLQEGTFRAMSDFLQLGFKIFSPRFRGAFQLCVTILILYRTSLVFRVTS